MSALDERLDEVIRAPVLLIASDFDGTIAPLASHPARAEARREALVALRALARMPQTHVAIISGRALHDLAVRTTEAEDLHLVGSHGSEFESGLAGLLSDDCRRLLDQLKTVLAPLIEADRGFLLEEKPAAVAFHFRNALEDDARRALAWILEGPASWAGVHVRHGKKVLELSVVHTDKGAALQRLRQRLGAAAVVFLGDDATDEDVFVLLTGPDVGIKVGPGDSHARHRIDDSIAAAGVLARLAERRADWLAGAEATPIEQHSLLSDQRTVALVGPSGRVVWLCLPRIDSAAVFAELLGGPTAGYFEVRPAEPGAAVSQSYVGDTFVLRTRWPALSVTDYLDCGGGRAYQRAGRTDLIRVIEGRGRVRVTFAPRLDFGRIETRLCVAHDAVAVEGAVDPLVLRAPGLRWQVLDEGRHQTAVATLELTEQPVVLELRYGTAGVQADGLPERARRERTERFWSGWSDSLSLPAAARDHVRRSALVLKALCYGPTGAIAAAATTSLPEHAGGVRNWDYRFCWPRDAAMSTASLVRLGATGPALKFLDWVLGILDQIEPSSLIAPVYTVTGGHLGPEAELAELAGYCGSRPVRISNAAAHQIQLDVFGPIAELLALLAERGAALSSEHWHMLERMIAVVEARWREPDHGVWELRGPRKQHVHSKVMCWQAIDRALAVARYLGRRRSDWIGFRDQIAADILVNGWHPGCNAFCATYTEPEADAATLAIGLSGLLATDDPRWFSTVDFVERRLRVGPVVYRYRYDDGLPGIEGGFNVCTAWLAEAFALSGRRHDGEALFDDYTSRIGPTGLLSEEYDPQGRRALGNYPQAYAHLGLIDAACRLGHSNLVGRVAGCGIAAG